MSRHEPPIVPVGLVDRKPCREMNLRKKGTQIFLRLVATPTSSTWNVTPAARTAIRPGGSDGCPWTRNPPDGTIKCAAALSVSQVVRRR